MFIVIGRKRKNRRGMSPENSLLPRDSNVRSRNRDKLIGRYLPLERFALMEIFAQKDAVNGERVTLVGAVVIRTVVFVALVPWMECAVHVIGDAVHHIIVSRLATNLGEVTTPKMLNIKGLKIFYNFLPLFCSTLT
ncbi:uncharacterized protein [Porites lutea]|uniref:uncharacterized protein n=1 Tax=Porites lutea TaxID=51062 RepID=UPI003CC62CC4